MAHHVELWRSRSRMAAMRQRSSAMADGAAGVPGRWRRALVKALAGSILQDGRRAA
jgi:hypothetical protein